MPAPGHVSHRTDNNTRTRQGVGINGISGSVARPPKATVSSRQTTPRHDFPCPQPRQLRHPEIQNLRLPFMGDKDICGLDVTMNDPFLVCGVQRVGNLNCQPQQFIRRDGLASDVVLERQPIQELHHDEGLPFALVDVVNRANVGVIEC